jgi:hypothetical protein
MCRIPLSEVRCYAGSEIDQLSETTDTLADLQAQLDKAVASEDYGRAAQLRDDMQYGPFHYFTRGKKVIQCL